MNPRPATSRGHAFGIVANVAVGVVLVVAALHLLSGLMSLGEAPVPSSTGSTVLSMILNLSLLAGYLVLVLRAPTTGRWIYLGLLTLLMLFAFGSALASDDAGKVMEANTTNVVMLLLVVGLLGLPAVYMRLKTPTAKH